MTAMSAREIHAKTTDAAQQTSCVDATSFFVHDENSSLIKSSFTCDVCEFHQVFCELKKIKNQKYDFSVI